MKMNESLLHGITMYSFINIMFSERSKKQEKNDYSFYTESAFWTSDSTAGNTSEGTQTTNSKEHKHDIFWLPSHMNNKAVVFWIIINLLTS